MKIDPVGAELSHADRRTDMINLTVAFCLSAKAPKKSGFIEKRLAFDTAARSGKRNKACFSYAALPGAALAVLP